MRSAAARKLDQFATDVVELEPDFYVPMSRSGARKTGLPGDWETGIQPLSLRWLPSLLFLIAVTAMVVVFFWERPWVHAIVRQIDLR